MKKSLFTSISISFVMLLLLSTFIMALTVPNKIMFISSTIWTLTITFLTFMIFYTGKISKYRSIFFTIFALSFVFVFISNLIDTRGSMALTDEIIKNKETPFCPVAIPQLILPALIKGKLIFPSKLIGSTYGGIVPVVLLWIVSVFTLGRGFCSYGCFYGGIDEGFSNILKKPLHVLKRNKYLVLLPISILLVSVFWSFLTLEPEYCKWLCPLKTVTEYVEVTSITRLVQALVFIVLGISLLFIFPIVTKKRTQCGFFCPLGALNSIAGAKLNPYKLEIDKTKCTKCKKCISVCPVLAISIDKSNEISISNNCTRCGKCMDNCKISAIYFSLKSTPFSTRNNFFSKKVSKNKYPYISKTIWAGARFLDELIDGGTLFVFSGLLFGGILSGTFVPLALAKIWVLIS